MFGQDNRTDMDKALDALGQKGINQASTSPLILVGLGILLLWAMSKKK